MTAFAFADWLGSWKLPSCPVDHKCWNQNSPLVFFLIVGLPLVLQVRLGKNGVEEVLGLGALSNYEKDGLEKLKPELKASIEKGIKFANQN